MGKILKSKLEGKDISSAGVYYENISLQDTDGNIFYLSPQELTKILSMHNYQLVPKRTRTWIVPVGKEFDNWLDTFEEERIKKVLDLFEHQTVCETGVRKISGGFAIADMTECTDDWIYITLKWGVQSDCENTVHEEDYKLDRVFVRSTMSIKDMVANIQECN